MKRHPVKQSFRLSEDLKTQVTIESQAKLMTVGEVIRTALTMYLGTQATLGSQDETQRAKDT